MLFSGSSNTHFTFGGLGWFEHYFDFLKAEGVLPEYFRKVAENCWLVLNPHSKAISLSDLQVPASNSFAFSTLKLMMYPMVE